MQQKFNTVIFTMHPYETFDNIDVRRKSHWGDHEMDSEGEEIIDEAEEELTVDSDNLWGADVHVGQGNADHDGSGDGEEEFSDDEEEEEHFTSDDSAAE